MLGGEWRAETLAFNEQLGALLATLPGVETVPPEVTRRMRYEGTSIFPPPVLRPEAEWADANGVRVRVLPAPEPRGVYLHVHGGGWTLGAADQQDPLLWQVVEGAGLTVVSVDYRLAPEHPHPAALEDCVAAARWLPQVDAPHAYTIGGESAGAHLAALTLLRLRGEAEFRGANLVYGGYDLSGTPSRLAYRGSLVLTDPGLEWFVANVVPGLDVVARRDPSVSPLYADLSSLPPALFTVGTLDPLLDDTLFMAARWRVAGNEAELRVYEGGVHGFNVFPISIGRDANEAQVRFLRDSVA